MTDIYIIGDGGHAGACLNILRSNKNFKFKGFVTNFQNSKKLSEKIFFNKKKSYNFIIGIGQIKTYSQRLKIFNKFKKFGHNFPVVISKHAIISKTSKMNEGTIVMHSSIVGENVKIGKNCILNSGSLIEHDAKIEDYCHISTSATVNGSVIIKRGTFIGSGSVIDNNVTIGKNCIIGSGKVIKKNIPDNSIIK